MPVVDPAIASKRLKLPRWLVVSLLTVSVLAMLGAGAWWWVTWPQRTAQEFIDLINAGDLAGARQILTNREFAIEITIPALGPEANQRGEPWTLDPVPRSLWDVFVGRQEFKKLQPPSPLVTNQMRSNAWPTNALVNSVGMLIVERGYVTTRWDLLAQIDRFSLGSPTDSQVLQMKIGFDR